MYLSVPGLSCGTWALKKLWHVGYKFPDQGSNPGPLNWVHGVLSIGPPGKSLNDIAMVNIMSGFGNGIVTNPNEQKSHF